MQGIKKQSFIVVISLAITLGIVVAVSFLATRTTFVTTRKGSSQNTSHIVIGDASIAHTYMSLNELKSASTLIVMGTVVGQKSSVGNHGIVYTVSTLRVERILLGKPTTSSTVQVRQQGGIAPDGTRWIVEDFPLLNIGSRYILYLTPSPYAVEFYPVGAPQGVFVVNTNSSVSSLTAVGLSVKDVPLSTFIQEV